MYKADIGKYSEEVGNFADNMIETLETIGEWEFKSFFKKAIGIARMNVHTMYDVALVVFYKDNNFMFSYIVKDS